MNKKYKFIIRNISFAIFISMISFNIYAEDIYQQPTDFINEIFSSKPPKSSVLWITKSLKPDIYNIMGHKLNALRIRYWIKEGRTVWILNEIGKQHPITVGFSIKENKIQQLKVLIFRESRGGEVRHDFFTNQFKQLGSRNSRLNKNIDGISGATLSVIALKKMAILALYFHKQVINK